MSDRLTFANTLLKTDNGTFRAGDVIRSSHDGGCPPWSQCIILGFSGVDKYGECYVKLARPYAYASCVGTTCAGVLTGVEEFTMSVSKLAFEKVLTKNGNMPMIAGSVDSSRPGQYESEVIDMTTAKKSV
jgi:hypothetical protein